MKKLLLLILGFITVCSCNKDPKKTEEPIDCSYSSISSNAEVYGYSILSKIPGIWNGSVTSSTPLGSYPEWIVDFRPISPANVSAKNELDPLNDIFMSFFIVKHDCENKIAFRNGGSFAGFNRNSYMLLDSIFENSTQSFFRFTDAAAGFSRVYSDITFKQDSFILNVYTNQYNNLSSPVSHMKWKANLRDNTSAQDATNHFNFPQKSLEKDFSNTFNNLDEAVFYSSSQDPFPAEDQPYLGQTTINLSISNPSTVDNSKKVLLIIGTEPLFNGFIFDIANLDFRSRYVFIEAAEIASFEFNYMHPGTYYLNAIYDINGDFNFSSGDYMNSNFDIPFNLSDEGSESVSVDIDFLIP